MGIYSDGKVYGVSLVIDNVSIIEKTNTKEMTGQQIQEIKTIYDLLSTEDRYKILVRFYTSAVSTYNSETYAPFMTWFPVDVQSLELLFIKLNLIT